MKALLIFGSTSLAKQAYYYAVNNMGMNVLGFVLDADHKSEDAFLSLPIFSWQEACDRYSADEVNFFVAIGYKKMRERERVYSKVKNAGYALINILAPSCYLANDVSIGDNNIIMPGAIVEPGTSIGNNNVIWSNSTICHDSSIGSHNFIAANTTIGGEVKIGNNNFLGFSSTILQQLVIGDDTLIAAQALLTKNTQNLYLYKGCPAKKIASIDATIGITI